jgi:Tfp pilus assembly protein PilV
MIASVVLALAVVAVAGALTVSHAQAAQTEDGALAVSLARQLMEEISAKPLVATDATPGWPADHNRAHYDSINDYAGYNDTAPATMLSGSTSGTRSGFARAVTLTFPTTLFNTTVTSGEFVLINVKVTEPSGRKTELNKLVARTTYIR